MGVGGGGGGKPTLPHKLRINAELGERGEGRRDWARVPRFTLSRYPCHPSPFFAVLSSPWQEVARQQEKPHYRGGGGFLQAATFWRSNPLRQALLFPNNAITLTHTSPRETLQSEALAAQATPPPHPNMRTRPLQPSPPPPAPQSCVN